MHREAIIACAPYLAAIALLAIGQAVLLRFSGARPQLRRLLQLHRDERGAVQSLSFILTLPVFMFIMMFIVQLSLITMARISVEYAAYAATRSAVVWFPADLGTELYAENRVSPSPLIPIRWYEANGRNYVVYRVVPEGDKVARVHLAAALACMPICPSTNTGVSATHFGNQALDSIQRAYQSLAPGSVSNTRIPARLRNKLAYALANTWVEIEIHHCSDRISGGDPPLYPERSLELEHPTRYLRPNEIGWQDQVYVTVWHNYALLPGPGRLLARRASSPTHDDDVADQIQQASGVFFRTLGATARMGNEGQITSSQAERYVQPLPWIR
jgi:hypothetical protein